MSKAYHGGAFFNAIGESFQTLEKSASVISADVLDAWFDPAPNVIQKIKEYASFSLKNSPPTYGNGLISTIARVRNISEENLIIGGGSSDIMFSLLPNINKKDDTVLILDPMYGEYQHIFEDIIRCKVERFLLKKEDNFEVDMKKLLARTLKIKPQTIVIVNPNSPTGKKIPTLELIDFCKKVPKETFILVDECYIDYINSEKKVEQYVNTLPNTGVIKSMSKAYALSGARVAYAVLPKDLKNHIESFIPPWAVSLFGQIAGVEALLNESYYQEQYRRTNENKALYIEALKNRKDLTLYDSEANFVLIELLKNSAKKIYEKCKEQNVFIRNCDSMSVQFNDNFVRLAVKSKKQTTETLKVFLKAIDE